MTTSSTELCGARVVMWQPGPPDPIECVLPVHEGTEHSSLHVRRWTEAQAPTVRRGQNPAEGPPFAMPLDWWAYLDREAKPACPACDAVPEVIHRDLQQSVDVMDELIVFGCGNRFVVRLPLWYAP